jgi:glycosyltransferase involved in cell wall biosynthesis
MKICYISFFPPDREGEAFYCEQLVEELRRNPLFKFVILAHTRRGLECPTMRNNNLDVSIIRVWDMSDPLSSFNSITNLLRAIITTRPDIVHLQYGFTRQFGLSIGEPFLILTFITRVILRVKTVVSLHNFWLSSELEQRAKEVTRTVLLAKLYKYYYFVYCKLFLSIPNKVVHLVNEKNSPVTKLISMLCGTEKVVEVLHGIPRVKAPENYFETRNIARKRFHLDNRFVILLFGTIRRGKGYENVIFAAKTLLNLDETLEDKLTFLIAGAPYDDDARRYLLYLVDLSKELKVDHIVRFVPQYLNDVEVRDCFAAVDMLILPYTRYSGPSGVLELAFAYETPTIAVCNSESKQTKDDLPILCIKNPNPETIASMVLDVFRNREVLRSLRQDIKLMKQARSMEVIAKEHVELYRSLLELAIKPK